MPEIAAPQFVGGPSADYPWPFFGYRPIPGREACEDDLTDRQRTALAAPLARFLKRLHTASVAEPLRDHLPGDVWGRLDMAKRVPQAVENFRRLCAADLRALPISESIVEEIAADALNTRPLPAVAVVHGDFHFRHVIVNERGAWVGAIDWGDMHFGNPALDLQIAWSLLPPEARGDFWSEYGPVTEDQLAQARLLALYLALVLFEYGLVEKLESVRREAERALQNLDPQRPDFSSAIIAAS
jgi:aminoglycoside phosphotransferase (APT) family kinase protein